MSCAACAARVEGAVSSLSGVEVASVNLLTGSLSVEGAALEEEIISAVKRAGYGIVCESENKEKQEKANNDLQNSERRHLILRLVLSFAALVPLMYLSMGYVMWGAPIPAFLAKEPIAVAVLQMLLSLFVLVVNGKFFKNGFLGLVRGAANMDTLVSLGSGASFIYSVAVIFLMISENAGGATGAVGHYLHELYFESAAMILALITVGKALEERAKGKTTSAVRELINLKPKVATVIIDGREVEIPTSEIKVGDIFILRPGDVVPTDGVVIFGDGGVDESPLTGESIPVYKTVGDSVLAASVNKSGFLRCEATKVGKDTAIAAVIRMVEDATATKAPIAKVADKVAGVFVPVVMSISLLAVIINFICLGDFGYSLGRGIAVLVISCPCALGLATPVAVMVGSGVGARLGILFKSAEALELSARATTVLLDKTGTVTKGEPEVTDVIPIGCDEVRLLDCAASVEYPSEHPLGRAIVAYAEGRAVISPVTGFNAIPGAGVRAMLEDGEIIGASFDYISTLTDLGEDVSALYKRLADEGKTPLFFLLDGTLIGVIAVADTLREDSAIAVSELNKMGIFTVMLTGDNERTAMAIGNKLGVNEVISGVLPDGKEAVVRRFQENGRVIMVGDGINDAPALVRADVGIAIGAGTDIAIDSADVVLMRNRLSDVPRALRLGRETLGKIYGNLAFAFIYNIIGIPLAAGAFTPLFGWSLSPMFGALAMSLSSLSVVSNALTLTGFERGKRGCDRATDIIQNLDTGASKTREKETKSMKFTMKIKGMMCPHCEARVKSVLLSADGVASAIVSHESGEAVVEGNCNTETLIKAVTDAGYEVLSIE